MTDSNFWASDINAEKGTYGVRLLKDEWYDDKRNRLVPYKIYYPDLKTNEKAPVILWSHGFGGNRDGASFLSRYLASFGYILVHITHDGTDSSLWEGKPGHPWDILRKAKVGRDTTLNRFKDVPFVLDQLQNKRDANADIFSHMNLGTIGMSGHSFGALSTQVALGQLFPDENDNYQSYSDAKISAGIAYSPVSIDHLGPDNVDNSHGKKDADIYGPIDKPVLYMTGTKDSAPIGGAPYDHRFKVFEKSGTHQKYLLIKEDGDHMVYAGSRGKLGDNPHRVRHERQIEIMSLAFWKAFLDGDEKARAWLDGDGVKTYLNNSAELRISR